MEIQTEITETRKIKNPEIQEKNSKPNFLVFSFNFSK
jgi:hypothetical protein